MKKIVFKYLNTKFPNQLGVKISSSFFNSLDDQTNTVKVFIVFYSNIYICSLYLYPSGINKCIVDTELIEELNSWFGLYTHQLDEIVFEWILIKESNLLVHHSSYV